MKLLIVNADDFGLAPSVSRGILHAFTDGIVSSTTVMANIATPDEFSWLKDGMLPFGVHLNLNRGWPLVPGAPQALVDARGEFAPANFLKGATYEGLAESDFGWIAKEFAAQVERVEARSGKPTHLDSHHHTHRYPRVFELAVELAKSKGVGLRPCVPEQVETLKREGVPCPECFSDEFFDRPSITVSKLKEIIEGAGGRSLEIMCHPGYFSGTLKHRTTYLAQREEELSTLLREDALLLVESSGYTLGCYAQLEASK